MSVDGHERFEACAAHVERAVAEEASEEWEGPGEYHLPEPVDPVGEGLAFLAEASRPCRSEKVSLGLYAESVHARSGAGGRAAAGSAVTFSVPPLFLFYFYSPLNYEPEEPTYLYILRYNQGEP